MTSPAFTEEQVRRYARHIILPGIGGEGQRKLLDAKVLCIGAGGLGSPVAMYLAAAGVGTLGVVDFDRVDESNLQRQIIHSTADVGPPEGRERGGPDAGDQPDDRGRALRHDPLVAERVRDPRSRGTWSSTGPTTSPSATW